MKFHTIAAGVIASVGLLTGIGIANASPAFAATCHAVADGNRQAFSYCDPQMFGVQHRVIMQCSKGTSVQTVYGPWVGSLSISRATCPWLYSRLSQYVSWQQTNG